MLKELYLFCIYILFAFLIVFTLSLSYASSFIYNWCLCLDEGLVLHDSTEWVWAIWITALFLCLWGLMPYYFFLLFIWFKNFNTKFKILVLKWGISLFFYIIICSYFIFIKDLFNSGFFLPNIKNISFEFQPSIESYLTFLFGFYFDILLSFLFFQFFLISVCQIKNIFLNIKKYTIILYLFTCFLFYYWFGGEGLWSDFLLFILVLFLNQIIIYNILIFKHLRMYKIDA